LGHWAFLGSVASFTVIFMSYLLWWSRLAWAVSADHALPAFLGRLHPRYGTPHRILLLYALGYSALALFAFEDLLVVNVWVFGAYDLLLVASVVVGRSTSRIRPGGFRIPGGRTGIWLNALAPDRTWVLVW